MGKAGASHPSHLLFPACHSWDRVQTVAKRSPAGQAPPDNAVPQVRHRPTMHRHPRRKPDQKPRAMPALRSARGAGVGRASPDNACGPRCFPLRGTPTPEAAGSARPTICAGSRRRSGTARQRVRVPVLPPSRHADARSRGQCPPYASWRGLKPSRNRRWREAWRASRRRRPWAARISPRVRMPTGLSGCPSLTTSSRPTPSATM